MKLDDFVARADGLIALASSVLATKHGITDFPGSWVDESRFSEFRSAALSFISQLYGEAHPYFRDFNARVLSAIPSHTEQGSGILRAVRNELSGGWLRTTRGLVAAEVFADFLEMADHLLDEGYKDAAAVVVGSVLEGHLRQLCHKNSIPVSSTKGSDLIPHKADTLNSDLARAAVYRVLDQKNVTAWLDLRNKAAHGYYGEYNSEQVRNMRRGVLEFMARVSP